MCTHGVLVYKSTQDPSPPKKLIIIIKKLALKS